MDKELLAHGHHVISLMRSAEIVPELMRLLGFRTFVLAPIEKYRAR